MDEIARATSVGVRRGLTARFASGLVEMFQVSTIETFLVLKCQVATEYYKSVPDT